MDKKDCIIALKEEIGNEDLFVGRKKQLEKLKHDDKEIETACHFCGTKYHFDEAAIDELIKEIS